MSAADGNNDGQPATRNASGGPAAGVDRPEAFGRGRHERDDDQHPAKDDDDQKDDQGEDGDDDDQAKGKGKKGDKDEDEKKPKPKPFYKRPVVMTFVILILLAGIAAGIYAFYYYAHYASTDDAFIDGRIIHVAPRVAGKVSRLRVNDNEAVTADQVLLEVDPTPFLNAKEQAVAARVQAEAQLEQSKANLTVSQAQAAQADADVVVAQANARNAQQNFKRFQDISPQARSKQQLDQATADQRSTAATVDAQQKRADAMHAMVRAAQTTVDASVANVRAGQAKVDQTDLDLTFCHVVAGYNGRVTLRRVNQGDYVTVGQQLMTVVPTDVPNDVWVTANFKETQLQHMKRGQRVTITIDAFPDETLHGHVDSLQNGSGAVFSLLPPENATGNYVKVVQRVPVKITIDGTPRHTLSPGLSVVPTVEISSDVSPDLADTRTDTGPPVRDRGPESPPNP